MERGGTAGRPAGVADLRPGFYPELKPGGWSSWRTITEGETSAVESGTGSSSGAGR